MHDHNDDFGISNTEPNTLISMFIRHPVAANLFMVLFVLLGVLGLQKLNKQIFPTFDLDYISVSIAWRGATAEDVQTSIIKPLEQSLRNLSGVRNIRSQATNSLGSVTLEMEPGADINGKINDVRQRIDGIRNFPTAAEEPVVNRIELFQQISQLLIYGDLTLEELRRLAYEFEDELLRAGISKVDFNGLPNEEIIIELTPDMLVNLGLTFAQIAQQIQAQSQNLPAGSIGRGEVTFQIRSISQKKQAQAFETLVITDAYGARHQLGDVATIEQRIEEDQPLIYVNRLPAAEIILQRTEDDDALRAAEILMTFYEEKKAQLPETVQIQLYNERWRYLKDRIQLLLENGASGLLLVVFTLFLFLNFRIAWWVALGIPVSIMATLYAIYLFGGSINMISLFALIMSLGIIVDDAIVVGEETLAQWEQGASAFQAANRAAHRMIGPVVASSLTTVAAFTPLALVGGVMGKFMIEIPITVICVILASLIESFFILPGHIYHSFRKLEKKSQQAQQQHNLNTSKEEPKSSGPIKRAEQFATGFSGKFNQFRDTHFRNWIESAIHFRWPIILGAAGMIFLTVNLISQGYVRQTFFPTIDGAQIFANAEFSAGTPADEVREFLNHLEDTLYETETHFGGDLVQLVVQQQGASIGSDDGRGRISTEIGGLGLEIPTEGRQVRNREFMDEWESRIIRPASLEKLLIAQPSSGPPGRGIEILLKGKNLEKVKAASEALQQHLSSFDGLSNIDDNLPYGRPQMIVSLAPQAYTLGITERDILTQIRNAYAGVLVDLFNEQGQEIEIRVQLAKAQRDVLSSIWHFPIRLTSGEIVPLHELAVITERRGIDIIRQQDSLLSVTVAADVDESVTNANEILMQLRTNFFEQLQQKYTIETGLEGRSADQAETMRDLGTGVILGLTLIYIILAWVFGSYLWPIAVMLAIPLGLTGAIFGHWFLAMDLSLFSMMGLFGLSGIVINDSIVLIVFFREQLKAGIDHHTAMVNAICLRLRAVLLTSLTTIAGLTPILFETSLQAQYLKPMAVTLVFGLAYGTFLILFFIPAFLTVLENGRKTSAKYFTF